MHLKCRVIRFLPLVLAIAALALPARAEDWYLKTDVTDATKAAFTTAVSSLWTNKTGEAASKIETTDDCHVENGKKIITNANLTFPGSKLHLGAVEGLTSGTITLRTSNLTANDLRWHSGTVNTGYAKRSPALAGNIYVDCEAKTHTIDASTGNVLIQMKAAFHGGSTAKVKVAGGQSLGPVRFSGDSSDYLGSFSLAEASTIFILANANTLGSSETARSDALSIDAANAVAAVQKGTIPNSARGIVINKSGFAFTAKVVSYDGGSDASRWSSDCSEYELPMPISGSYGFSKTGTGTVTLSGAYTAGAITVSAGTLHLAASSSFPLAQAITVKAGAQLVVHNKSLQSFSITAEEGAVVERVVDPIVPAYDPDAKTVTTVERTDLGLEDGEIQTLALSNKIALPSHDALELEVLRITAGSRDYTEADFEDAGPRARVSSATLACSR